MISNNHGQPLPVHAAYADSPPVPVQSHGFESGKKPFTPADIPGPYFLEDSPHRANLLDAASPDAFTLTGTVFDRHGVPIPRCKLDFWQANAQGLYSGFAEMNSEGQKWLRGHQYTDEGGGYSVRTIRPGHYKVSDTQVRTAHLHVIATAPDGTVLTTQLYFPDDPANAGDPWEQKNDPLLLLVPGTGRTAGMWLFDFTLRTNVRAV